MSAFIATSRLWMHASHPNCFSSLAHTAGTHDNSGWAIRTASWRRCRKNKRARRTTRKQTNSKRVFLLIVVRLTWLELKSAVTLIGLNVFASLEKIAMSEWEQAAEMIKIAGVQPERKSDNDPAAKFDLLRWETHLPCPNTETWTGSLSKTNFASCSLRQVEPSLV